MQKKRKNAYFCKYNCKKRKKQKCKRTYKNIEN